MESRNFTEEEAEAFCTTFNIEKSLTDQYNNNPRYLSCFIGRSTIDEACRSITRLRTKFADDLNQELCDHRYAICKVCIGTDKIAL